MKLGRAQLTLLIINALVVVGFGWYYSITSNYEFLAYVGTIVLVIGLLYWTLPITKFSVGIIAGITAWAIMHMLGGSVMTDDGVLYAYRIVSIFDGGGDFFILKYDQFVHAFLYGVVGLMFYHLLRVKVEIQSPRLLIAFIAIFAAAGFSIINEIVEFLAVVNLPETGVGGYHNTVLDMFFNLTGATITVLAKTFAEKK